MSSEDALKEVRQTVVLTLEDCKSTLDFWKHFEIPVAPEMQSAFDKFMANLTFENQQGVKWQLCRAIKNTDHPALKDEMFKKIVEECSNVDFLMEFDHDLEKALTDDSKT